ncbi:MAG: hypothetical protein ACQES2_10950 [Pseudomonadota bacterium]
MKRAIAIVVALVALLVVARWWMGELFEEKAAPEVIEAPEPEAEPAPEPKPAPAPAGDDRQAPEPEPKKSEPDTKPDSDDAPSDDYGFDQSKIDALRNARDGDARTPPIERSEERELPTPEELADPELYAEYETRHRKALLAGFVKASQPKIEQLEKLLEQGRQHGMTREDLQEGEEKLKKLKEMREELLREDPSLADIETPDIELPEPPSPDSSGANTQ